jgi:CHAD domain-containing protein
MKKKPGPVPKDLTARELAAVRVSLRRTRSITATVADLRRKGKPLSNARVRAVATAEGLPLDHELRRAATPQIMELAKTLRAKGESATAISDAVYDAIGYEVTPQYINKMLAGVKSRRSPRRE